MLEFVEVNGRRYGQFARLRATAGLVHAYTTRPQDVSVRRDDRQSERAAHRAAAARDLGLDPARLQACVQVHRTRIEVIEDARPAQLLEGTDGVIAAVPGVPIMTFSADCPLIVVFDPVRRVVGLVHASWRCTTALVTRQLVEQMAERCGSRPADLLAGIGPGAGPCCYEVRSDVYDAAAGLPGRDALFPRRDGRMYFDLWAANRALLSDAGLADDHIETAGVCTLCRNDVFYSFRREGPGCGHFGLIGAIR